MKQTMSVSTMIGLALLIFLMGLTTSPTQDSRPDIADATIEDLAWIAGQWQFREEGQFLQETWGAPVANSMTGMFTWQRGETNWLYEFLLIEQTDEGITYYLRHFVPGCVAWETKDKPLTYPLKELGDRKVVFENPERNDPKRFIFSRQGDALTIRIESEKEGDIEANVFKYTLAK